jgi:hypothetical protein
MKMEATCSSETSVDFQPTTRRYIPEERSVQFLATSDYHGTFIALDYTYTNPCIYVLSGDGTLKIKQNRYVSLGSGNVASLSVRLILLFVEYYFSVLLV